MNSISLPTDVGNQIDRAQLLAHYGMAVFPLNTNKRPFENAKVAAALGRPQPPEGQGGSKLATRDADAIGRLWMAFPGALIGIATGQASHGLIVLDVDRKNGRDGLETLNALKLLPPQTLWQQTRSGGYHYLYRDQSGRPLPTDAGQLGDALDRRGDGGYIVDYGTFDPTTPIAPAPDWLLENGKQRSQSERSPLRSPELAAPSFGAAVIALNAHDPNNIGRDQWISITASYKQAVSSLIDDATAKITWDFWCSRYENNDTGENDRQWKSIRSTSSGWAALRDGSPKRAELLFGHLPKTLLGKTKDTDIFEEPLFGKLVGSTVSTELVTHIRNAQLPIAYDIFANEQVKTAKMPWDKHPANYPTAWTDDDDIYLQAWFHRVELKPSMENVKYASRIAALRTKFNPVTDYLDGLQWDGLQRLNGLFERYFSAANIDFARIVSPKFLIGMVARAFEPGCKRDEMVVLEGDQGTGKSTALNIIASDAFFSDSLPNLNDKEAAQHLRGLWLVEVAELAAMKRSEVEDVKRFSATRIDVYRPTYGRHNVKRARTSVFVATTNDDQYLKDSTGARRFWPIKCGKIDLIGLQRDRDQLFAEAVVRYRNREPYHLTATEGSIAATETAKRNEIDAWHDIIARYCAALSPLPVSMDQLFQSALSLPYQNRNSVSNKRVAGILRTLGYHRRQIERGGPWMYVK